MSDDDKYNDMNRSLEHEHEESEGRVLYTDAMLEAHIGQRLVEERTIDPEQRWKKTGDCVDGRLLWEQMQKNPDHASFGFPGGGLGIELILIAAAEQAEIPRDIARNTIESVIGTPTAHTDSHEHSPEHAVAGCGFCNGMMFDPDFKVDSSLQEWFAEQLLPRLVSQGMKPKVLAGEHKEGAVIVVRSDPKGTGKFRNLPHQLDNGLQAFVFHQDEFEALIDYLARKIYAESGMVNRLSLTVDQFAEQAIQTANKFHAVVLKKLAKKYGLPMYVVELDGSYQKVDY